MLATKYGELVSYLMGLTKLPDPIFIHVFLGFAVIMFIVEMIATRNIFKALFIGSLIGVGGIGLTVLSISLIPAIRTLF